MKSENQKKGITRNKLLRYKKILEVYLAHKTDDIPTTVIYRKHIYPTFFISRKTLYTVLDTPVARLLKELENTP